MTITDEEITPASQVTGSGEPRPPQTDDPIKLYAWEMEQDWESHRDRWGKPEVKLPDSRKRLGYKRASSYGGPLESSYLLDRWKMRQVLMGAVRSQALRMEVTRAEHRLHDNDPKIVSAAKNELNDLVEKAMEIVGSSDAAAIGTALHDILEHEDLGRDPGFVPEEFRADVSAYVSMRECFRTVSSERIVVEDKFLIGGKYDRCVELLRPLTTYDGTVIEPGQVIIGDVKTSQSMDFAGAKFGVQCWAYANGVPYDPIRELRYGWEGYSAEDAAEKYGPPHRPPRTDWAVIMHVPSGKGIARLFWVDLEWYGKAVKATKITYDWRNRHGKKGIRPVQSFEDYALTARHARSVDDLDAAYARAVDNGAWTPELKEIFSARKADLKPPEKLDDDEAVPA